jgi:hypothetical protein
VLFAGLIADARAGRQIQRLTKQKAPTAFHFKKKLTLGPFPIWRILKWKLQDIDLDQIHRTRVRLKLALRVVVPHRTVERERPATESRNI